ncbi:MAG: hypothetical protein FXF47_02695 [Candidatus Mcinerneyibacterium aminivorans]|jgi:hypothetical protein|uniref:Uncharacterized protein n=1 Tax=Candidatus Mcinerneyibacterium aminivorans TaxID=2703815 RepID=A0A5D0MKQ9_9BACT|nr:MAG: hypothetical protein FXF47_02695 [Candidatus Mcinerneyibacterium aminivorans]
MFNKKKDKSEYEWDMLVHSRLEYLARDLSIFLKDIENVKQRVEAFYEEVVELQKEFEESLYPKKKNKK